jgi:hypothetical protein
MLVNQKDFCTFAIKYWLIVVTRRCYGRQFLSPSGGADMTLVGKNITALAVIRRV